MPTAIELTPISRLTRDIKNAAATLTAQEARYLVDYYYLTQDDRKRSSNQVRAHAESEEPCTVLSFLAEQSASLERQVARALDAYTDAHVVGQWARSITGIGPILSAGLLAHIDIAKAPTVGHIWRFAGLDPTVTWNKGEKRPWNASLKVLCWKIGESFVKVSGNPEALYGQLYAQRKLQERERNDAGLFAEQAAKALTVKRYGADTKARAAYESGKLPDAHVHARAKRWAVKLFLAHWHAVAYRAQFGTDAPKPYVLSQLGHAHEIQVPNWPF